MSISFDMLFFVYMSMEKNMYANVIIDIGHTNVDRSYCYSVPQELNVLAGHRVLVPFGAGNKPTEAFVISVSNDPPASVRHIKSIIKTLESYPVLYKEQLELAEWMAKVYHCLYIDALRLMIPAQLRGGRISEKRIRTVKINNEIDFEGAKAALYTKDGKPRAKKQIEVLELLEAAGCEMSIEDITGFISGSQSAIKALSEKGIIKIDGKISYRSPFNTQVEHKEPLKLSAMQDKVLKSISLGMDAREGKYLVHGVTGSGKTEIYMQAIMKALENGGSAIMLVPEISLTPQTVNRFRSRFGDKIAVLHSRLSAGERYDEWRRLRLGIAKIAVGARSAVFAPLEDIRIIIIDEEHEPSYQSETSPRYSAIDVAARRCMVNGAVLVLGSATPSIGDYIKAKHGVYTLLELPERISNTPMPSVVIADMREEFLNGNVSIFSKELYNEIDACLKRNEQAILFMNRRGYSTFVSCRGCGHVFTCKNCDITMTYHKFGNEMKCHYCGHTEPIPDICPECKERYIKFFGVGTQQVEEQLKRAFPKVTSLRMDIDTTGVKYAHENILGAFERGEAQVLIGTQMVAKGLDIPNVTLVGVVAADSMLYIPDFRSSERTFQLLTQVSGRAGRRKTRGKVVIQTYSPNHPAIIHASNHDYAGFYEYEIEQRRRSLFPPFSLLVRILFTSADEHDAAVMADKFAEGVKREVEAAILENGGDARELLSIIAENAPIHRKQGVFRQQVVIKFARTKRLTVIINAIYEYHGKNRRNEMGAVEINPTDML